MIELVFWKDAFHSLGEAIARLKEVLAHQEPELADIMRDAAIQRFEFVIELYWKVLKKILSYEKIEAVTPREVISKAFQFKLINDDAAWLAMLDDRNQTSYVYHLEMSKSVFKHIKSYIPILEETYLALKKKYSL